MGNLVCGAAGTNYFAGLLHEAQGKLSRVSNQRAQIAIAIAQSGQEQNSGLEAIDRALEQKIKTLEMLIKLLEGLQKAHEQLRDAAIKDAIPKFTGSG